MKVHIITIFPESFKSYFETSIIKKAIIKKYFEPVFYKLNDFSNLPTKRVDDKAYWMHGQVIKPEPLSDAIEFIFKKVWKKITVIYMSPSWDLLNQEKIENYKKDLDEEFIIICGHYEWIDYRIIDKYVDLTLSIWEYIISSWELAAIVFIDSLVRLTPWVLWNEESFIEDSFSKKFNRQKEHPVYTRPKQFMWMNVPEVLTSWNHSEIEKWKINNLT